MAVVSGGTTLIDNGALDAGVPTGSLILLSTQTASSSASIEFTSGIDSTYDIYQFEFINIHAETDGAEFQVNFRDGGSLYDAVKTTTLFQSRHYEDDSSAQVAYNNTRDIAQGTGFQDIFYNTNNDNDSNGCGKLTLFNPSSTTYVKHFISRMQHTYDGDASQEVYVAGYCNTTSAIDGIQFKFSSGNIDDGIIKMYGVK